MLPNSLKLERVKYTLNQTSIFTIRLNNPLEATEQTEDGTDGAKETVGDYGQISNCPNNLGDNFGGIGDTSNGTEGELSNGANNREDSAENELDLRFQKSDDICASVRATQRYGCV